MFCTEVLKNSEYRTLAKNRPKHRGMELGLVDHVGVWKDFKRPFIFLSII